MADKKEWLAYVKAAKKWVKDLEIWVKAKSNAELNALAPGTNPPSPPPPPPGN